MEQLEIVAHQMMPRRRALTYEDFFTAAATFCTTFKSKTLGTIKLAFNGLIFVGEPNGEAVGCWLLAVGFWLLAFVVWLIFVGEAE